MHHLVAGNPLKDVRNHPSEVRTCEALICAFILFPLRQDISSFLLAGASDLPFCLATRECDCQN